MAIALVALLTVIASTGRANGIARVNAENLTQRASIPLNSLVQTLVTSPDADLNTVLSAPPSDWTVNANGRTNYGQSEAAYWFRFRVNPLPTVQERYYLRLHYPNLDRVEVFFLNKETLVQRYITGDTLPFNQRPVVERDLLFPLHNYPHSQVDVYLKIQSEGPIEVPLDLITRIEFDRQEKATFLWLGMYFGVMLIMFFYNLFIYAVVRDRAYLYYIAYVACTAILQFSLRGLGFQYVWSDSVTLNNTMILLFACLMPLAAICFVREFLRLEGQGSLFDVWTSRIGLVLFGSLFLASFIFPYFYVLKIVHGLAFVTVGYGFYLGVKYWLKGLRAARTFAAAWFIYMVFIVLYLLEITGYAQTNSITKYALEIGSILELVLLSLAFGDRINQEKENIGRLLSATKALSSCPDKVAAAQVALAHINELCRNIDLSDAVLFLPQKNSPNLLAYSLWRDRQPVVNPTPSQLGSHHLTVLRSERKMTLLGSELFVPVDSEKRVLGYLRIGRYQGKRSDLLIDGQLIESVMHALAQTMDAIDSEEKDRLSMVGSMAAAIVHDLKNPIGAIKGCAELAAEPTNTPQEQTNYLTTIVAETQRMQVMTQEILEYSRGEMALNIQLIKADSYMAELSNSLRPLLESVDIGYQSRNDIDGCLKLDADRIRRVVFNLVTNARDAMLTAETDNPGVKLAFHQRDKGCVISVSDNGPGIPERIQANLFEPFVTHGKVEGTGLGMAIVKKIVMAHQGDISFQTSEQGTRFEIALPESVHVPATKGGVCQPDLEKQLNADEVTLKGTRVLLAEDNQVNQMVVAKYLSKWGMLVECVGDGLQALEALTKQRFDLVLMDVEMPQLDGLLATQRIRMQSANAQLPIIGLTAHAAVSDRQTCIEAGMNSVLTKPIDKDVLREALLSVLILN